MNAVYNIDSSRLSIPSHAVFMTLAIPRDRILRYYFKIDLRTGFIAEATSKSRKVTCFCQSGGHTYVGLPATAKTYQVFL